jgi:serine/threonine protein kinase
MAYMSAVNSPWASPIGPPPPASITAYATAAAAVTTAPKAIKSYPLAHFTLKTNGQAKTDLKATSVIYKCTGRMLGKGSWGSVQEMIAIYLNAQQEWTVRATVAVKLVNKLIAPKYYSEIDMLDKHAANVKNAVQLHDNFALKAYWDMPQMEHYHALVFPYYEKTLTKEMYTRRFSLAQVQMIAKDVLEALSGLHGRGVVHADLKPCNVMCLPAGSTKKVVVIDFGAARKVNTAYFVLQSSYYRAPEIAMGLPCNTPMDVWSFGCMLYELLTGKVLFPSRGPLEVDAQTAICGNKTVMRLIVEQLGLPPASWIEHSPYKDQFFTATTDSTAPFAWKSDTAADQFQLGTRAWEAHIVAWSVKNQISAESRDVVLGFLRRVFVYENRITAAEALRLPLFS